MYSTFTFFVLAYQSFKDPKFTLLNKMPSSDAVHFPIENFNEDLIIFTIIRHSNILELNPRLTKLFFVTHLTKGSVTTPSLDFPNRTPFEIDFGINR